jgi:hypothetical protein
VDRAAINFPRKDGLSDLNEYLEGRKKPIRSIRDRRRRPGVTEQDKQSRSILPYGPFARQRLRKK